MKPMIAPIGVWADDRIVVLAPPKTGSTWVRAALDATLGPKRLRVRGRVMRPHASYDEVVTHVGDRRLVSVVRDPWTWYASTYAHLLRGAHNSTVRGYLETWGGGSTAFADVLRGFTRHYRERSALLAPDDLRNPDPTPWSVSTLWAAHCMRYGSDPFFEDVTILRTSTLAEDLADLLHETHGVDLAPVPPANVGDYDLAALYLEPGLDALVYCDDGQDAERLEVFSPLALDARNVSM